MSSMDELKRQRSGPAILRLLEAARNADPALVNALAHELEQEKQPEDDKPLRLVGGDEGGAA